MVRPGLRHAERLAALLQRGGCDRGDRRGPRSRDPPHPGDPRRGRGRTSRDDLRRRLPDPRRDERARLHPRSRPRRRPPPGDRSDGAPGTSGSAMACSCATSGTATASPTSRSSRRPRPSSGARSRVRSGRADQATRRPWSPQRTARQMSSAGDHDDPASTRWSDRRGPGASRTRTATPTRSPAARSVRWQGRVALAARPRLCRELVTARPVVAHRPHEPHPDEHRDQQAQDRDLVRADPDPVDEDEQDQPVQQRPDDLRALADEAVQTEELADPLGRRQAEHQDAVGHRDAAQPRTEDRAGDEERRQAGSARGRSRSRRARARQPTIASTVMSVRFGPIRSHSQPHTKLMAMATTVSPSRIVLASRSETPSASVVTTLITTMTVLTASL